MIPDFCIEQIANSGQCFRITQESANLWKVMAFRQVLYIRCIKQGIYEFDCSPEDYRDIWENYFDLKRNYASIKKRILELDDPYLKMAVEYGFGIRVLKQDLWEVIISFMISQHNSIPKIRGIISKLCEPFDGVFPLPHWLRCYEEDDFAKLGLGYRSQYLSSLVRSVADGRFDLERLKKMQYPEAIEYLKKFKGIGDKVANCIALYGLHLMEAFPMDVWIKRVIQDKYNGFLDISKFDGYAGIVQQYMFCYERFLQRG